MNLGSLGTIALGAGLQDAFNPCVFMAGAFLLLQGLWLRRSSRPVLVLSVLFILVYAFSAWFFNMGFLQDIMAKPSVVFLLKCVYFLLGAGFFVLGILSFLSWRQMRLGQLSHLLEERILIPSKRSTIMIVTVVVAFLLAALATFWPTNYFIIVLSGSLISSAQWGSFVGFMGLYTMISLWPLWFLWLLLVDRKIKPTLLKIVCAAIFITASSSMIFIFK